MEVNNKGFVIPLSMINNTRKNAIIKELTVKPFSTFGNFSVKPIKIFRITNEYLIVPVYYAIQYFEKYCINFNKNQSIKVSDTITLRDNQKECYAACEKEFDKPFGGGIITLSTGQGKTILSLKMIASQRKKTLIIVNKVELLNQWKKEISIWIPDAKIGIIQGKHFEIDADIILGMLQTITLKDHINPDSFTKIDMCIIDECHNIGSEIFSKTIFKTRPRYVFGLTATLERKDKLDKIIKWYMGNVLYSGCSLSDMKQFTEIRVIKYFGKSSVEKLLYDGTVAVATMLTNMAKDNTRTDKICECIIDLLKDKKRNILVISDRIFQLKYINKKLGDVSGLFIGGMKEHELNETKLKRVVLGTYALVNEGFNLPKLNCLVFATPRSSIIQAIGRIYRKHHDCTPVIVDVYDEFSIFIGQYYKRKKIYRDHIDTQQKQKQNSQECLLLDD